MQDVSSFILEGIYLKLYELDSNYGNGCISFLQADLDKQAECFKNILSEYEDIDTGNLFSLTPVSETYDYYRAYLFQSTFHNSERAYLNERTHKLVFSFSDYYVKKRLKELEEYEEPITKCAKTYAEKYLGYVDFSDLSESQENGICYKIGQ